MLKGSVGSQNRVVGLDDGARQLRCRVHAKLQLRFFPIICRQTLKKERAKTGPRSSAEGVEHKEALQACAVIRQATEFVHHRVNELLSNGVVTASIYGIT